MRFCVHNVKTQKRKEAQRKYVIITSTFRMLNLRKKLCVSLRFCVLSDHSERAFIFQINTSKFGDAAFLYCGRDHMPRRKLN